MTELERIDACAKRPIDIWTNYLYYPLSIRLVYLIRNTRITPNAITLVSLVLALAGCAFFAAGLRRDVLIGLLLVQVSYVFDCADGQLARYRRQYSPFGGWLDQVADRIKEFAIYFSLAWGTWRTSGDVRVWPWALVALFALYLLEYYGQIQDRFGKSTAQTTAVQGQDTAGRADKHAQAVAVGANAHTGAPSGTAGIGSTGARVGGQQVAPREVPADTPDGNDTFSKLQHLRSFVPFRGFIIGEQYFALLVFILLGAVYPLFVFVSVLGLLMCIYRPAIQFIKLMRSGH